MSSSTAHITSTRDNRALTRADQRSFRTRRDAERYSARAWRTPRPPEVRADYSERIAAGKRQKLLVLTAFALLIALVLVLN